MSKQDNLGTKPPRVVRVGIQFSEDAEESRQLLDAREKPSATTGISMTSSRHRNLTRLAPDWERQLQKAETRMITLFKILISKWFHWGLEYPETELLVELGERLHIDIPVLRMKSTREVKSETVSVEVDFTCKGNERVTPAHRRFEETRSRPALLRVGKIFLTEEGLDAFSDPNWLYFLGLDRLYTEEQLRNVLRLASIKLVLSRLTKSGPIHEQTGKLGVKRERQRGYRDGRGSPRDPRKIGLALAVDREFFTTKHEQRWKELDDLLSMIESVSGCSTP